MKMEVSSIVGDTSRSTDENNNPAVQSTPVKSKTLMFDTSATPHPSKENKGEIKTKIAGGGIANVGSSVKSVWNQGPAIGSITAKAGPRLTTTPVTSPVPNDSTPSAGSSFSVAIGSPAEKIQFHDADVPQDVIDQTRAMTKFDEIRDGSTARPRVCLDINNAGEDMLHLSNLAPGMNYERILKIVEPYGDILGMSYNSEEDPLSCEVIYKEPASLHEAVHGLHNSICGNSEKPLKAVLRSRQPGAQLFVGDLTSDVTEDMLEETFTNMVGSRVTAQLKRDPETHSPIGYGFLSFENEATANIALVQGHRIKVGTARIRVGRAERNTHVYVTDLAPEVEMSELTRLFSRFGPIVEEDTVIVRRSYAFVRFKDRTSAELAKRTLDKTDFHGRMTVRYAEAEPLKACISVQFHSSYPHPPGTIRELLVTTFSKYGNCQVEIPHLRNGNWRKVAFVTFLGEPVAATLAATEAVQSVRFVSTVPVCCQFARELIPRIPPRDLRSERGHRHGHHGRSTRGISGAEAVVNARLRVPTNTASHSAPVHRPPTMIPSGVHAPAVVQPTVMPTPEPSIMGVTRNPNPVQGGPDMVAVYVPVAAIAPMHMPQQPHIGMGGEAEYAENWDNRGGGAPNRQW